MRFRIRAYNICGSIVALRPLNINASETGRRFRTLGCRLYGTHIRKDDRKPTTARPHDINDVRNIGIIAHIDAGKTTTTERMLYYAGSIRQLGNIDEGSTTTDYMMQERARGITIQSAAVTFYWKGRKINLIDTPGHVDFTFEVGRCLRVLDGAVAVLDASAGVEAQTLMVWQQANHYAVPRIIYLNKMDKRGADVDACLHSIRKRLNCTPLLTHLPLGREKDFEGVVHLPTMTLHRWPAAGPISLANADKEASRTRGDGAAYEQRVLTAADGDLWRTASDCRVRLIDELAVLDETLLERTLSAAAYGDVSAGEVEGALGRVTEGHSRCNSRRGTAAIVVCGSSYKNCGVQPMLDAVVEYLPSPAATASYDEAAERLHRLYGNDLCALAFKTLHDKQRGLQTFVRVYSGEMRSGSAVYNATRQCAEKITRLSEVFADEHVDIAKASAGDIVAVTGFKETITGDTIVHSHASMRKALASAEHAAADNEDKNDDGDDVGADGDVSTILAGVAVPEPVFLCCVEAPTPSQQKLLDSALACLLKEDPSLRLKVDGETGQTILMGMGELHLEVVKDRIISEYGIEAYMGPLQISYRETLNSSAEATASIERVIADVKNSVTLKMSLHPKPGCGVFKDIVLMRTKENDLSAVRRPHRVALINGVRAALSTGPLLGFPFVDVEVQLSDFVLGERRTSLAVIAACASDCVRKALLASQCSLLEPIVKIEVSCYEQHLQTVLHDLARRRALTQSVLRASDINRADDETVAAADRPCSLQAEVPLSELLGYATTLRTITSGMGAFTMAISGHLKMSAEDTAKVISKSRW